MRKIPEASNLNEYFGNARRDMIDFIPRDARRVLEVGCGTGQFAKSIHEITGAEIWGVEINAEAAEQARQALTRVFVGGIEAHIEHLPDNFFDCICMNDVIEHLLDPWSVLRQIINKLSQNGVIVASIPNVRHYKNLSAVLLDGEWRYTNSGVLDKTHLRFFTPKSMKRLFTDAGYSIVRFAGINKSRKFKLRLLNWLFCGKLWDIPYVQFAVVAAAAPVVSSPSMANRNE